MAEILCYELEGEFLLSWDELNLEIFRSSCEFFHRSIESVRVLPRVHCLECIALSDPSFKNRDVFVIFLSTPKTARRDISLTRFLYRTTKRCRLKPRPHNREFGF